MTTPLTPEQITDRLARHARVRSWTLTVAWSAVAISSVATVYLWVTDRAATPIRLISWAATIIALASYFGFKASCRRVAGLPRPAALEFELPPPDEDDRIIGFYHPITYDDGGRIEDGGERYAWLNREDGLADRETDR